MAVLLKQAHSQSAVARLSGVTEGTVRYQRRRQESGAVDGRSRQTSAVAAHAAASAHWREQQTDRRIDLAALHDWRRREHGDAGSLKSACFHRLGGVPAVLPLTPPRPRAAVQHPASGGCFRERDMQFAFKLWSHAARVHAP